MDEVSLSVDEVSSSLSPEADGCPTAAARCPKSPNARDRSEHTKRLVGDVAETPEFSYVGGLAESAANVGIMDGRRLDKLDGRRMLEAADLYILYIYIYIYM